MKGNTIIILAVFVLIAYLAITGRLKLLIDYINPATPVTRG